MTFEKAEFLLEMLLRDDKDWFLVEGQPVITDRAKKPISKIRRKKCPLRQRSGKRCRSGCKLCIKKET